jgi:AcrR family transcriptional regulator
MTTGRGVWGELRVAGWNWSSPAGRHGRAEAGRRGPGRPRDEHADAAILEATRELLETVGYAGLTLAGIAERAEVGKGTLYRRWPSKGPLVVSLLRQLMVAAPAADTGELAGDLRAFVAGMVEALRTPLARHTIPGIAADILDDADLATAFHGHIDELTRDRVAEALARAAARGEAEPDADPVLVGELLVGAVLWRMLLSARPLDDDFVADVVRRVVDGLRPRGTSPA